MKIKCPKKEKSLVKINSIEDPCFIYVPFTGSSYLYCGKFKGMHYGINTYTNCFVAISDEVKFPGLEAEVIEPFEIET